MILSFWDAKDKEATSIVKGMKISQHAVSWIKDRCTEAEKVNSDYYLKWNNILCIDSLRGQLPQLPQ